MTAPPQNPPRPRRNAPQEGASGTGTTGASDTPPRRPGAGPAPPSPGGATRRGPTPKLQRSLEELFSAPALAYSLAGDQWAAGFVAERGPVLAEAWYKLAQENPAVRRILERVTQGSAWGGVIVATGGTALPLLAHHGLLPAQVNAMFQASDDDTGAPIVPPPPAPTDSPPGHTPGASRPARDSARGRGRDGGGMTPPLRDGQPPGVVTVAGSNSNAIG